MTSTPDSTPGIAPSPAPQDWMVTDLQAETRQLGHHLATTSQQISEQVTQLSVWADSLPTRHPARHVTDHDPVRVADLARNDLPGPLSLARQVRQLGALLDQAAALSSTLMTTAIAEHGLFGPTGTSINDDLPPAEPGSGADSDGPARPAGVVEVVAYCHSDWNDNDVFERQRQAIRTALEFDGIRAWHGTLPADINQELHRWQAVLAAAEAGATVQVTHQLPR